MTEVNSALAKVTSVSFISLMVLKRVFAPISPALMLSNTFLSKLSCGKFSIESGKRAPQVCVTGERVPHKKNPTGDSPLGFSGDNNTTVGDNI
jgi:hypothetical protein